MTAERTAIKLKDPDSDGIFYLLFVLNLAAKLLFLNWNLAEYTDSIHYFTTELIGGNKWMPAYPFLIRVAHLFFEDVTLCGKLTAITLNALSLLPLYAVAKRIYGKEAAIYASMLFIVSPLITRWSIRAMAESSFLFFLLMSLWCFIRWADDKKGIYAAGFVGFSGFAALARPEGLGLLPAVFLFMFLTIRADKSRTLRQILIGLLPWGFLVVWHARMTGKYIYSDSFIRGAGSIRMGDYLYHLGLYVAYLPYLLTPFVFLLAAYGMRSDFNFRKGTYQRKLFDLFFLYWLAVLLLALPYWPFWTTRFIFSIVALSLIFAGHGLALIKNRVSKMTLVALCLATGIICTAVVLVCSRETFGDIKSASLFVRDNLPSGAEIASAETVKTAFWSGRRIAGYERSALRPGMYVVLQNMYCDIDREMDYLKQNYDIRVVYMKEATVVPVLADDIYLKRVPRGDGTTALRGGANAPISPETQFGKQSFKSAVIFIKGKNGPGTPDPVLN